MFDLAIIGGGPAGVSAGVYAARKRLKTVFIAETIGGQSTDSVGIENWIGTPKISGLDLAKTLETHLKAYASDVVELHIGTRATNVKKHGDIFSIQTPTGVFEAKAVLITTGGSRKKLQVPGASEFENKGVTYCASCDGPLFADMDVAVIGGGNAGFETCAQLLAYAKSVTLIHRSSEFEKADAKTVEAVLAHPKMKVLRNTEPTQVKGTNFVNGLTVKNIVSGEVSELSVSGVFVEIGMNPGTDLVESLVELDAWKRIKVDARSQRAYPFQTSKKDSDETQKLHNTADGSFFGVWAAGDCTDELYHQNNIAAGNAITALEDIYFWLRSHTH